MKRLYLLTSLQVIIGPVAMAQAGSSGRTMLEEVVVTAEKRSTNLQDLASSVAVLSGDELTVQGKITTEEILESVPNVRWDSGGAGNQDNNIAIRGVQRTQNGSIDNNVLPATTAIYVDGVYQGIGGQMDVNRVEVLRGPQGTLYGRSATGGVVAFYTNDPKLEMFEGSARVEGGSNNLLNVENVVNIPIGDKVAVRVAGHYYSRDGYFDPQDGETQTKEGRLKLLYQPTDALRFVLAGTTKKTQSWSGGWSIALETPDKVDFHNGRKLDYTRDGPRKYNQISLNTEYQLSGSTLTWIAGYHDYEYFTIPAISYLGPATNNLQVINYNDWPTYNVHTEELRWQSDSNGPFTWLVGANYFHEEYVNAAGRTQIHGEDRTGAGLPDIDEEVPFNTRNRSGDTTAWGIFTEETLKVSDNLRVTAGLRLDKSEFVSNFLFIENFNFPYVNPVTGDIGEPRQNPPIWAGANAEGKKSNFTNWTYKLRFEYDLTPDSMVYAMTSTGFLPGSVQVTPTGVQSNDPNEFFAVRQWDQQKLTSYEIGSKNQFLDNRLRVNGAMFLYDQTGWPNNYNLNIGSGRPANAYITIGNDIFGIEGQLEYLLTLNDRVSLNAGYLKTNQKGYPETVGFILGANQIAGSGEDAIFLDETPGFPEWAGSFSYLHTFTFGDGSILEPRVEFNYQGSHYTSNLNRFQAEAGSLPYLHQDAYVVTNAALSWTAANGMYRATLWGRNVFDEQYKEQVDPASYQVNLGAPATYGLALSAKF
jgi:iron complex outermembrane recepter protein